MERSEPRCPHGVQARFEHRVQFASRRGMAMPARSHEDVNALSRLPQGFEQEQGICEQIVQTLVRPSDDA